MTLEQMGNLGEFFGSIAVLVTLIYLTEDERRDLDVQLEMFSQGLYGLWFDDMAQRSGGFDRDFMGHVGSLRAARQ